MRRCLAFAAAAAAIMATAVFSDPVSAARFHDPSLKEAAPTQAEDARHWRRRHWRHRYWGPRHHRYGRGYRYRHCWYDRVRVRTAFGYVTWRNVRRCGWRWR